MMVVCICVFVVVGIALWQIFLHNILKATIIWLFPAFQCPNMIDFSANQSKYRVAVNIAKLCCHWLKQCKRRTEGNQMVSSLTTINNSIEQKLQHAIQKRWQLIWGNVCCYVGFANLIIFGAKCSKLRIEGLLSMRYINTNNMK